MNLTALEQAAWVYSHQASYDRQQRFDAAVDLGEWGIFSYRQIGAITGLSHSTVQRIVKQKADKTGGRFDPECLGPLVELRSRRLRGEEVDPADVRDLLARGSGTSAGFAAKLGGLPESWIRRQCHKAKEG